MRCWPCPLVQMWPEWERRGCLSSHKGSVQLGAVASMRKQPLVMLSTDRRVYQWICPSVCLECPLHIAIGVMESVEKLSLQTCYEQPVLLDSAEIEPILEKAWCNCLKRPPLNHLWVVASLTSRDACHLLESSFMLESSCGWELLSPSTPETT